jgi:protein-S-isoprenylcysteine O-methyltransferase Ste14
MSAGKLLELKFPPVAVLLVIALLMGLSVGIGPQLHWLHQRGIGVGLILGGVLVGVLGVVTFRRAHTTVDPRFPQKTTALVTSGIYRVTRNPMYLGMLLALAGWACWLGQILPYLALPIFVIYINRWQIAPEERALEQIFRQEFMLYRARVRRWL